MTRSSGSRSKRSGDSTTNLFYDLLALCVKVGGLAFICISAYLLWGILSYKLANAMALPKADQQRIFESTILACKILRACGIVFIISTAVAFYAEEVAGYLMLLGGSLLFWGLPMLTSSTIVNMDQRVVGLAIYILAQFKAVGIVGLAASVPLIMFDFWIRLSGRKRRLLRRATTVSDEDQSAKSRLYINCWQMPYCRDYLRRFCKAYQSRKTCWRIRSGCYCDENMILRAMKSGGTGTPGGFDQRFTQLAGKSKQLTAAQKRARCRQCFLYARHQEQKFRIVSPFAFIFVLGVMWVYSGVIKGWLREGLSWMDKSAAYFSFLPKAQELAYQNWSGSTSANTVAEWLFLGCAYLILVTFALRLLEVFIFDLQV